MPTDSNLPEHSDEIRDLPPHALDNNDAEQVKGGIIIVGGRYLPPINLAHVAVPTIQGNF